MRHFLISVLLMGLVAGCSSARIGPHRIDVQQGNALDQENVARLKPGLNRSQVRFLLGTPLVVDPFRTDRWDYVYMFYKAGKLAEQKRITLFFDGDTLARIEGDLPPPAAPAADPQPAPADPQSATDAPAAEPKVQPMALDAEPAPVATPVEEAPSPAAQTSASSVVQPLSSPENAPAHAESRPQGEPDLQSETDAAKIQPDVMPVFPDPYAVSAADAAVLNAVNEWAAAWSRRDADAFLAAYDASFVPQTGGSRAEWETRRRRLLEATRRIDIKIDSLAIDRSGRDGVTVSFNQYFQSERYRDAVVKQLRMVERDGRWLIAGEKVVSILKRAP